MKIVKLLKYILMVNMIFVLTNVYALENDSGDENLESHELYEENEEPSSDFSDEENEEPSSKICEKKLTPCYPIPSEDSYSFSYSKDTGPNCCRRAFVHGEFLWFRPMEQGLEYAVDQDFLTPSDTFPLQNGKVEGLPSNSKKWAWRPGCRVGIGSYSGLEKWNFEAIWTYVNIKDHSSRNRNIGVYLPLFFPPSQSLNIQKAEAKWSGNFNTADLFMGKPYHVSRYFISHPMFGLRAAFIKQHYYVVYYVDENKRNVYAKNDYRGIGLRGLYEGQFLLGRGWSIYGKVAYSLLFGKFDISQRADETDPALFASTNYYINNSFYDVQSNTELRVGICFNICSCCNQLTTLKLGYELHQWLDQNHLKKFNDINPVAVDTLSRGNLSFNGFMFEVLFEF